MAKFKVEFDGFDEMVARLSKIGGSAKKTTEKALKATHSIITKEAEKAIKPHRRTGATERSLIKKAEIEWGGLIAEVEIGFDIDNGGLPSIFLMYGTPRIKKDQKLYNAFKGKKTLDKVHEVQEEIFFSAIRDAER
ncbi:hypothetical protein [Bacteroides caecimuris]|jgi:hypothetical protein|uniref:hypothetical protein n=1 Tax=Bacteroides caecimuris TaxID=1796613 RepID=UPI0025706F52|nr:hypothetical protein [Bacteroides caecimuris]